MTKDADLAAIIYRLLISSSASRWAPRGVLSSSVGAWQTWSMKRDVLSYRGYRFPPEIISHAVWLYHRFGVSFRDVEDLLAQRGLTVSYEAIRLWCIKFGAAYARRLKRRQGRLGDTWHLDEVFVTIQGRRHYLWRAVDQDGDVIDILVQSHRDCRVATRFFRLFFDLSTHIRGSWSSCNPMKIGVFLSAARSISRFCGGRLRGPRSWMGGLLGGVHA